MSVELKTTLALAGNCKQITADMVRQAYASCGISVNTTAMNNRLEDLRELGFLERTKQGRNWFYSIKPIMRRVRKGKG